MSTEAANATDSPYDYSIPAMYYIYIGQVRALASPSRAGIVHVRLERERRLRRLPVAVDSRAQG